MVKVGEMRMTTKSGTCELFLESPFYEIGSVEPRLASNSLSSKDDLELPTLHSSSSKCWDYRCAPHCLASLSPFRVIPITEIIANLLSYYP